MSREEIIRLANVLIREFQEYDDDFIDEVTFAINSGEEMEEW